MKKRIYRDSEPIPPITQWVPPGLVGYEERKREEREEAARDRAATLAQGAAEAKRVGFIANLGRAFPQLNVPAIAESVEPWDLAQFKERVAEAQVRYLQSRAAE